MPDDQPGTDAIWWFLTDFNYPTSGVDTLAVFTNTDEDDTVVYHYTVFTIDSDTVYDDNLTGSEGDIFSTSGSTIVALMSPSAKTAIEIDLDADGTNDHWAAYVYFDMVTTVTRNDLLGQSLLVNLGAGMASMSNIPMKEWNNTVRYPAVMTDGNSIELFSPAALKGAIDAQNNVANVQPTSFALYPRYYIHATGAKSYLILWKSVLETGLSLHVNWWNAEENHVSSNIPIPHELNFIDIANHLPATLHSGFPKEGWINMRWPDKGSTPLSPAQEYLAWTWLMATGAASESWTGFAPVARAVNTPVPIP
jgi:hypothetical protein